MIIETSSNVLYFVTEPADADLAHCWRGLRVKQAKGGYVVTKNAKEELVRKAGCRNVAPFDALKGSEPSPFRIVNTKDALEGPHGTRYVHDASRPYAVLFNKGIRETCCGRYPTEQEAKRAVARFTAARARYAGRNSQAAQ